MTLTVDSYIDDDRDRSLAYRWLEVRISRTLASLALIALGAGCNTFIGLEGVSLVNDGGVGDPDAPVDAPIDAPVDAMVDAGPTNLFLFVTNASFNGGFGAANGARVTADVKCDDMYQLTFTSLGCNDIHAVIQVDDNLDTLARMDINFPIPQGLEVLRAIDDTPVAANWDVVVDPNLSLLAPVSDSATSIFFWSGRGVASNLQCTNWTSASSAVQGNAGDVTKTNGWTARANIACNDIDQRLLCVCW